MHPRRPWRLSASEVGASSPGYPAGVDVWPLVGRRRELSRLTATVVARRGAVITGPAGVGKTTLARSGEAAPG